MAAITILIAVILALAVYGLGFAAGTACTNHFNCTNTMCSPACDRVNVAASFGFFGQVGVIAILGVGLVWNRLRSVWIPLVALALSAEMAWAAYAIAASWSSVH